MKDRSLKQRILAYFQKKPDEWVASGTIQRLVAMHTKYVPRTAVRRMEKMAENKLLDVEIRKGHAWYRRHVPERVETQAERLRQNALAVAEFDREWEREHAKV